MKILFQTIFMIILVVAVVIIAAGGLVLLSYGVGWILTRILPLSAFEATLLSLIALIMTGYGAIRLLTATPPLPSDLEEARDDDEDLDEGVLSLKLHRTPRRSRRNVEGLDFTNVNPEERCPCGSGRKYKNCHGRFLQNQTRSDA